jgi:diguanylate cyclase (GGDEF)-like protein
MQTSLRRRLVVPFAVGLVGLVALAGAGGTLATRGAMEQELEARALSAAKLLADDIDAARSQLAGDAGLVAGALPTGGGLAEHLVGVAEAQGLDHARVTRSDGTLVAADSDGAWERRPAGHRLVLEVARSGRAASAVGLRGSAPPMLLAAARAPDGRVLLLGRAVGRKLLAAVEQPLGVVVTVRSATAVPATSAAGVRTMTHGVEGLPGARVDVAVSSESLSAATRSALLAIFGAGAILVFLLLALLDRLVQRAVVRPVRAVTEALGRLGQDRDARLPVGGAAEVRALASGFNAMADQLGAQRSRLEVLAATDPLTRLANHRHFRDALVAAADTAAPYESLAVVLLDLDHFKVVNDTYGHPYGDEVLREVGDRLRRIVREGDLVGRLGGEEFALLLPDVDAESAVRVAERARAAIRSIPSRDIDLDCSAGVAVGPHDAQEGERLLELADAALYRAKAGGRARTCRWSPHYGVLRSDDEQRAEVRTLLDEPDRLSVVFQPIVDLQTGRVAGFEALARVDSTPPKPPNEWFGLARRCGLAPQLEALAVTRALAAPDRPADAYLSLNLDPSVLGSTPVIGALPADLRGIVIEITEEEAVLDPDQVRAELAELRARGARIAVDDAGAGYAGLQHIVRLQPDIIKIDRSLISGLDRDHGKLALIDSFTSFARRTGATVCAEGIETEAELETLVALGVGLGQGYLLGKPASVWAGVEPEGARILARPPAPSVARIAPRRAA